MRLDRLLGQLAGLGRSAARRKVASGHVCVGGKIERDGCRQIGPFETVSLGDEILQKKIPRYVLLNKPAGILSATTDVKHSTVISLIHEPWADELHLAGRLDRAAKPGFRAVGIHQTADRAAGRVIDPGHAAGADGDELLFLREGRTGQHHRRCGRCTEQYLVETHVYPPC